MTKNVEVLNDKFDRIASMIDEDIPTDELDSILEEELEISDDSVHAELVGECYNENDKEFEELTTLDKIEEGFLTCTLQQGYVSNDLTLNHFRNPYYQNIFSAIDFFARKNEEKKFDPNAVSILLAKRSNNNKYMTEIIPSYLKKDERNRMDNYLSLYKAELIQLKAKEITDNIYQSLQTGNFDYLKTAATELNNIQLFEESKYDTLSEALDFANFEIQQGIESDSDVPGVSTGIPSLDEVTGGLHDSDFIVLAARPGQGKTATAINFAYNGNVPCGFISSEMPSSQLALRLLSLDSGVNAQKLRRPKSLTKEDLRKLKESSLRLRDKKQILIFDKPNVSIQEVKEIAIEWKEKFDIRSLFIDYIQRLTYVAPGSDRMPRHERIGMVALESKEIARLLKIPVVGLAQINRGVEKNEATGGRPLLSDLKDSGMIEQEADLVLCPFRENLNVTNINSSVPMLMLILKNRHGPLVEIDVVWIPANMKIIEDDSFDFYASSNDSGMDDDSNSNEEEQESFY